MSHSPKWSKKPQDKMLDLVCAQYRDLRLEEGPPYTFRWDTYTDTLLFHAMIGIRPIGCLRHVKMVGIHCRLDRYLAKALPNFPNSEFPTLPTEIIWKRLGELYDLDRLNKDDTEEALDDEDTLSCEDHIRSLKIFRNKRYGHYRTWKGNDDDSEYSEDSEQGLFDDEASEDEASCSEEEISAASGEESSRDSKDMGWMKEYKFDIPPLMKSVKQEDKGRMKLAPEEQSKSSPDAKTPHREVADTKQEKDAKGGFLTPTATKVFKTRSESKKPEEPPQAQPSKTRQSAGSAAARPTKKLASPTVKEEPPWTPRSSRSDSGKKQIKTEPISPKKQVPPKSDKKATSTNVSAKKKEVSPPVEEATSRRGRKLATGKPEREKSLATSRAKQITERRDSDSSTASGSRKSSPISRDDKKTAPKESSRKRESSTSREHSTRRARQRMS